jgi:hypothetical protein
MPLSVRGGEAGNAVVADLVYLKITAPARLVWHHM